MTKKPVKIPAVIPPRLPKVIWVELRGKLKTMNKKGSFKHEKNAEECAMAIQRLQREFKEAKAFHIRSAS